ncbi:MAG: serine--tRNA ligase [Alphaproteobacteria bacterium]|nr:serine--tRNA ligase [Alphaproteobacteria bacterium]
MHDIKYIRDNAGEFDKAMARRGLGAQSPAILALDEERRGVLTRLQEMQARRNDESRKIGEIKKSGGDASAQMEAVAAMKVDMAAMEGSVRDLEMKQSHILAGLPNIMGPDVPDGADESENVELRKWGEIKSLSGPDHVAIGEGLGLIDFETAAKMSGARFTLLSGPMARMERALVQFFLDTHTGEHGYTEVSPPLLVRDNALYGTGQLPKFSEDLFKIKKREEGKDKPDEVDLETGRTTMYARAATYENAWLIPTAEVPLTNIVAEMIVEEDTLPRRYAAFTPCFRSEAGAAGKDTRGMLRQHQFYKVEMVSVTAPEESAAEHERMTACAETVLRKLELPFRTIVLCSGDTGFGATKTYDIEVWLPGQETYREISSCSNCKDFQARRMNARMRSKGEKETRFVHTLNGSGVAVGRALIAVIENYYDQADGGVWVPEALKPYMGGLEKITV